MKKVLTGILVVALLVSAGTRSALAAGHGHGCHTRTDVKRTCNTCSVFHRFLDADGDGVCDNCSVTYWFVDENGDGLCDTCSALHRFLDKDGDGICDSCSLQHRFLDTDGDACCDYCGLSYPCEDGTDGMCRGYCVEEESVSEKRAAADWCGGCAGTGCERICSGEVTGHTAQKNAGHHGGCKSGCR